MATQAKNKKKRKADYETDSVKLGRLMARLFFYLMMIVVPCYYDPQAYLNMIGAKGQCAQICIYIALVGVACYYFHGLLSQEYKIDITFKRWNMMDFLVVLLSVGMMIACFTSVNYHECLSGEKGFYNGALKLGLLALMYFFVSRHVKAEKKLWNVVLIVVDVATFWLFLNFCSIDVFGLHAMILESQFYIFSSCLGNADSISAYYSIIAAVVFVLFINEEDEKRYPFMVINTCFAALGVLCVHSDGVLIGMFFFSIIYVLYAFRSQLRLARTFLILTIFGAEMTVIQLLHVMAPKKVFYTDDFTNVLMGKWVGVPVLIVFSVLYFFANKALKEGKSWNLKVFGGLSVAYSSVASVGFVGACVYIWKNLDPMFGSGRGAIWAGAYNFFLSFDTKEKIFGVGPHMVRDRMSGFCAEAGASSDLAYATCHNGILEILTTLGIFGLVLTIALWAYMIVKYLKGYKTWDAEPVAYMAAAFAYLGQSLVGNPYSMTVPMFITIVMLYRERLFTMRVEELKALESGEDAVAEEAKETKSSKNSKGSKKK